MPRLGFIRRRRTPETPSEPPTPPESHEEAPPIEPFVPVEAAGFGTYEQAPAPELRAVEERAPRRLPRPQLGLARPRFGWSLRLDVLLLALALIAGGIAATLIVQDRIKMELDQRWPVGVLVLAGLWMLLALLRGQVTAFLGGAALAGVGLALLMDVEDIAAFDESVLGVVLVTLGLGIVIRGLVMRPSSA